MLDKDHDDQPQPQPHGAGFDDAHLQRGDRRGTRTFSGRAPSASPRRSESPQLTVCSGEAAASRWSSTTMHDDDRDRPDAEDLTVPELGAVEPPEPPELPIDWRTWTDDEWRAWEAGELLRECAQADADRAKRIALARERGPPE